MDKPVRKAAERLNATPVQVLLAWVRSKGAVVVTYVYYGEESTGTHMNPPNL